MELILAAFLLAWGGVSAEHPNVTFEQMAQASLDSKNASARQALPSGSPEDRLKPVNMQDPQQDAPKIKGVYATAHSAGGSRMNTLLELMDIQS
ncbi:hypothetical protein ACVLD2_001334 [Paenibacillus sp. PvR052]|nr:hypothetical protein [Paenibacillus sp. PvP091]MBP1169858.1 hypothetical protein [Paenibacillus sp. PvR098]MBP2440886.1 hypothetical protein [Paenibacillus sp. PvP052]